MTKRNQAGAKATKRSMATRAKELLSFAEKLQQSGANWVEANNALFGPGCKYSQLFPTASDRAKFANLKEAKALDKLLASLPEPPSQGQLPQTPADSSGKLVVRMPKSIHAALALEAQAEGVSLNQLIVSKLSLQLRAAV